MTFNPFVKFDCPICNSPMTHSWLNRTFMTCHCPIVTGGLYHYASEWSFAADKEGDPTGEAIAVFARFELIGKYRLYYYSEIKVTRVIDSSTQEQLFKYPDFFPIDLANLDRTVERINKLIVFS